jgi:site-specific DNA-methyltransferase (adenine-specific)
MDLMREFPDKYFDLAIIDPPYNIDRKGPWGNHKRYGGIERANDSVVHPNFFKELFRVSKNQIIWGGNYFDLPPTRCFVFWYKHNRMPTYADGEMAWTSFKTSAKCFDYPFTNFQNPIKGRIHPTEKPVDLYRWLLETFANHCNKILDTHLGSGSIAIACHEKGFDLTGSELDPDYFAAMQKRLLDAFAQERLPL